MWANFLSVFNNNINNNIEENCHRPLHKSENHNFGASSSGRKTIKVIYLPRLYEIEVFKLDIMDFNHNNEWKLIFHFGKFSISYWFGI